MSGELKNFPPSELKLERLRRSGEILFCEEVLFIGLAGGLLFVIWQMSGGVYQPLIDYFVESFSTASESRAAAEDTALVEQQLNETVSLFLYYLFVVTAPIITGVVLLALLQTRFLVTPSALSWRFGRLFSLAGFQLPTLFGRLGSALYRLLVGGVWIVVSWLILRYVFFSVSLEDSSSSLDLGQRTAAVFEKEHLQLLWLLIATFCFTALVGVGTYFVSLLQYRRTHRMTRSEVEAEYREMEPAPEFQSARSEQHAEDLE